MRVFLLISGAICLFISGVALSNKGQCYWMPSKAIGLRVLGYPPCL